MTKFSLQEDDDDDDHAENPRGAKTSARPREEAEVAADKVEDRSESTEGKENKKRKRNGREKEEVVKEREEQEEKKQLGKRKEEESSKESDFINVRIDPDVLDCSICFEPLHAPIFQCQNGHVACSSCRSKLLNKCHLCSRVISFSRCLLLEKVIESISLSCSYAKYGCKKALSYTQRYAHEETCIYAPCICPLAPCSFCGSREMLSDHIITKHEPDEMFCYKKSFKIVLEKSDPFRTLYSEDGYLFLLLNNTMENMGHALSMVCLRPSSLHWDFMYELTTNKSISHLHGSCLHFKSFTTNVTEWNGVYPKISFLLVPSDFCTPLEKIILDVCIHKMPANSTPCC